MKDKLKIIILGASGQGKVVLDILRENKEFDIAGFIDNNEQLKGAMVDGVLVFGTDKEIDRLRQEGIQTAIVAVGDNKERCELADKLKKKGLRLVNAIHPRASIASNVVFGSNITIANSAIICAYAVIEDNVIINTGAIVEHENIIGRGVHIASGVKLAGRVRVGEKSFIGIGAVVIQNVKIGKNSVIGAGAVVLKDIPDNVVAVGVPARVIKTIPEEKNSKNGQSPHSEFKSS